MLEIIKEYENYLYEEEKSQNTIEKYIRDIKKFTQFIKDEKLDKKVVLRFKEELVKSYATNSVNSILAAVNNFVQWLGYPQYKVKPLKIQKEIYSRPERELTEREYQKLIKTAENKGNKRLSLIIQTICSTGIRVSELKYITVESLYQGRATVLCKGKNRTIFIPKELCKNLKKYIKSKNIKVGSIFVTKFGKEIDRTNIWKMMKDLCKEAKVLKSKVFPHNLRHLFARTYYKISKDISRLADLLGHSSINTTKIYMIETGTIHERQIERMNLLYNRKTT
ncbi:MAG: tyrosine-type recombinase/integrase [Clostridia bacterium]